MIAPPRLASAEPALRRLPLSDLAPIVSRALRRPVTVTSRSITLLGGLDSSPMAGGVYKVAGSADATDGATHPYTVVVKILRSPAGLTLPDGAPIPRAMIDDPRGFAYWRRETLVAQSAFGNRLPAGLTMPRCLGVTPVNDDECWLWQTYLPPDGAWDWHDYQDAAFQLGHWQGAAAPRLAYPWLSRDWLAAWVHGPLQRIFGFVDGMDGYEHPLLTAHFDGNTLHDLRQLWADRHLYLERLSRLPQAPAHLDAHRGNLIRCSDRLTLIDWSFTGTAALGEELAAFVGGTLLLDYMPLAQAERLEAVAIAGYLAGLRAAGWAGAAGDVVNAYRCAMPLRYAPATVASMLRTAIEPGFAAEWEGKTGQPLHAILAHRAELVRFYLARRASH